ncbi:MAG: bifunctional GTP diphosphokinase/guanosine-3',5'-bis(diphosphate) 3'-diphosphatase [Coxiellaceae bacterium]|nr:bifunctional GTP diphosphokinase/guanosine-3',5'-bis(diphosphate) 3'-diphosphatase [Coxiellaceae bacterium]
MRQYKKLYKKLDYLDDTQIEEIYRAYSVSSEAHRGQRRRTGEAYVTHPVAVAVILAEIKMDYQTIMAALLHDVIEDTPVTKADLASQFGQPVAELVDGVSKLTQIEFVSKAQAQAENFRKMVLAMAKDIRVIVVKLADRLHNMRTLGSLPVVKRRRIAKETLEIFAPIAKRLGMRNFSNELEELGFSALYPRRYHILKHAVERARGNRKKVLTLIDQTLRDGISSSRLPSCVVKGREKHLYSIYRKMHHKRLPFTEVMDVYAFRIIVDSVDTCYRVLGLVHALYKPIVERFKDYIAIPKANGYQSLHTTLFGPYGLPIEIQIRTSAMNRMANNGIAAHWLYKSEGDKPSESQWRAQQWMTNLLELQQRSGNSLEFIESVKLDLYPDEVYVFTPKGMIMGLPAGATAVDFAYIVHTDIGNHCVAAKINRKYSPLSSQLSNGQTVEVITSARGRPSPAWLDFVVTSKARSSIRHFLKHQRKTESVTLGEELLQKELKVLSLSMKRISQTFIDTLLNEAGCKTKIDLLEQIGLGNRPAPIVAHRLAEMMEQDNDAKVVESDLKMEIEPDEPLLIKGTEGLMLKFATCCYPIPGDPIIGTIDAGHGMVVHHDKCQTIAKFHQDSTSIIPLRWSNEIDKEFEVKIVMEVINQRGVLAVLALAITGAEANIEDIKVEDRDGQSYFVEFLLLVRDRAHLATLLKRLRQQPALLKVSRAL